MKLRKRLGNTFTCLGGIVLFIGILACVLPKIDNQQLQLVIQSFRTPTDHWLLGLMNNGMSLAMDHCMPVILVGAALLLLGILLICTVRTQPAAQPAPQPRGAHVSVPVQANPFARGQQQREEEGNPFARYVAADTVTKRIPADAPMQPEPAEEPSEAADAAQPDGETVYYPLQADDEETAAGQETFYGLIDEDELPDDEDDEDDGDDFDQEVPVLIAQPVYDPAKDLYLLETEEMHDGEETEEPEEPEEHEEPEEPQESAMPEEPAPTQEPEPETLREKAEEAKQSAKLQTAAALRPAIRSTFRKSAPVAQLSADGESTAAQPVSRIKSTMGHKR